MTGTSSPTFLPFPALFFFFFAKICIGSPYWFLIRYWCRFTGAPSSWQIPAMCLRPSATSCKPRLRDVSRDAGACIVQAVPLYTVSAGQGSGETREREREGSWRTRAQLVSPVSFSIFHCSRSESMTPSR